MTDNQHRSAVRALAALITEWQQAHHIAEEEMNEPPDKAA